MTMKCTKCGSRFDTATNLTSATEIEERRRQVDITKAPSPEAGRQFMEGLGTSVPVYKCPVCKSLVIGGADAFIAMSIISENMRK